MKKIFILSIFFIAAIAANAQTDSKTKFAGGVRFAASTGNFHQTHPIGFGGELQVEHHLSQQVSLTGTSGFTNFIGKKEKFGGFTYKYDAVGYIPVLVGARYYPAANMFVGGKVGYGILTGAGSGSAFNFEPQVGYNTARYQLSVGYNALVDDGTLGHFGVTAVYKFN